MTEIVRVLAIPRGQEKDSDGRGWGDDWPLADFGLDGQTDQHIHLTTNYIHASELADMPQLDALPLATWIAKQINDAYNRRK